MGYLSINLVFLPGVTRSDKILIDSADILGAH